MIGITGKTFSQFRILCSHTNRTSIQMTFAHHDTTFHNQCSSCNAPFFCTQAMRQWQYPCLFSFVHLPAPPHGCVNLFFTSVWCVSAKPKFPWQTGMFDRTDRRCTCTTIMPGYQHHIGFCFCNTSSNGTYACFADQFHIDPCAAICIFQIKYQLRQIFNRINIVMRWRRDQSNTGSSMPDLPDPFIHFMAG